VQRSAPSPGVETSRLVRSGSEPGIDAYANVADDAQPRSRIGAVGAVVDVDGDAVVSPAHALAASAPRTRTAVSLHRWAGPRGRG
jgi:hypothetical protein